MIQNPKVLVYVFLLVYTDKNALFSAQFPVLLEETETNIDVGLLWRQSKDTNLYIIWGTLNIKMQKKRI